MFDKLRYKVVQAVESLIGGFKSKPVDLDANRVEIERGIFEWVNKCSDHLSRWNVDNSSIRWERMQGGWVLVVSCELIEAVGLGRSESYHYDWNMWFNDPYCGSAIKVCGLDFCGEW